MMKSDGETAAACVSDILKHLDLRAFDAGTGNIFDHQDASAGLEQWRAYRERVCNR